MRDGLRRLAANHRPAAPLLDSDDLVAFDL
jgi:hypothetical protein